MRPERGGKEECRYRKKISPEMKPKKFFLAHKDNVMRALVQTTDHRIAAIWANDCAARVLPYFEEQFPEDDRPRNALDTLRAWVATGIFKMAIIRKASLDAHAAAREVGEESPARSAARAAGQAAATAHVSAHAYGAAIYAQQAVYRASDLSEGYAAAMKERNWQYRHLIELRENAGPGIAAD
jgi:hypothetical protein